MAPVTRSIPTPATFRPRAPSARTVHRRHHEHTDMLPESIEFSATGAWRFAMAFAHSHPRAAAEMSRVPGGVRAAVDRCGVHRGLRPRGSFGLEHRHAGLRDLPTREIIFRQ